MCHYPQDDAQASANEGDVDSSGPSLEVDSDDRDSALGDNQSSYTMSVTSSVYDFKYENGRRYHAYSEGKYPVPNDEIEKDRLDLQHRAFRLTLDGRLYTAPLPLDIHHVLDVGCGTGIWTTEFADDHPSAQVIGVDLSPIQPSLVPPNCSFIIDDLDQDWIFHNKFDYIHSRAMVAAIKDWDRFFEQAFANLKPGGYLELQDLAFPLRSVEALTAEESPLIRWSSLFCQAALITGLDATAPSHFASRLRAAGFVDIRAKNYKWPVGKWAKGPKMKLLGHFAYEDLMDWLPSSSLGLFTRVLKWSREEVELFLADCRRELREKKRERHFYANSYFWVARKPLDTEIPLDQEFRDDEEAIEVDEGSQASGGQEEDEDADDEGTLASAPASAPAADPVPVTPPAASPGTLVDPTAGLSLASPTISGEENESPPRPSEPSVSRKSMPSMEDILNPTASGPHGARDSQTTLVEQLSDTPSEPVPEASTKSETPAAALAEETPKKQSVVGDEAESASGAAKPEL